MSQRLTVLIPCRNEQTNLPDCIRSVRPIADEILIADSGSTDRTLELAAKEPACRIIQRHYENSGNFKNWAIPQAAHSWVFVVDADERVEPALADEIRQLLRVGPTMDGYWIYRNNYFMGHLVRRTSWGRDKVVRLMRRDTARYLEYTDHTEVDLPRHRIGQLRGRMTHYTCWDYDVYLQKINRYTEQQAELWYRSGRKPNIWKLVGNGPLRFLRDYVVHLGILDGAVGFQVCALSGYYSFLKQARLWHKHHVQPPDQNQSRSGHGDGSPVTKLGPTGKRSREDTAAA